MDFQVPLDVPTTLGNNVVKLLGILFISRSFVLTPVKWPLNQTFQLSARNFHMVITLISQSFLVLFVSLDEWDLPAFSWSCGVRVEPSLLSSASPPAFLQWSSLAEISFPSLHYLSFFSVVTDTSLVQVLFTSLNLMVAFSLFCLSQVLTSNPSCGSTTRLGFCPGPWEFWIQQRGHCFCGSYSPGTDAGKHQLIS